MLIFFDSNHRNITIKMKLNEFKQRLEELDTIYFQLPNGEKVPSHFHVTEVGKVQKDFIDCGGKVRNEEVVNFQLWSSVDYDHRLHPEKLLHIIELSQNKLGIGDLPIEVEYQGETIGKYGISFDGQGFKLTTKNTDCLAKDNCGIPVQKAKETMISIADSSCCTPGGGCC